MGEGAEDGDKRKGIAVEISRGHGIQPSVDRRQRRLCIRGGAKHVGKGYVEQRSALVSRIRGLLSGLGIVLPLKVATVRREAHNHLEDLPGWCNNVVGGALSALTHLDTRIKQYDQ